MSLILTGNGNQIAMAAPGRRMLLGASSGGVTPVVAATPSGVPGLAGWWDASVPTGMLGTAGTPLMAFGAPVAAVADKSGATTALTVWHAASAGTTQPIATPRLNGLLGGLGRNTIIPPMLPAAGQQLPLMDPDQGLISAAMAMGSSTAWTLFLVWSRPNWRQSSNAASTLLSVGGTPILAGDNNSGGGRLVLFPGTQQTVLTSTLTRRHTHAVILRNTPGTGVDVWLDATQVATAAPNPMASALSAPLLWLHNGTGSGGAECWFHEAAVWDNALPASAINAVLTYETRWITGPRKGIQILITGQSNSGNGLNDGAWHLLAQGVAWHLGALGFGVVGNYGSPPAATCIHGEGIYPVPAFGLSGSFLTNPGDGSNPSTWNLGADGEAVQAWIQQDTAAEDAADIAAIFWPWSETDSTRQYSEKATYEAAARRLLSLERRMLNRTAASLPQVWWSAIPFSYGSNDPGMQMQREVVADMAADPSQNVSVVLPQTTDAMPRAINGNSALVFNPATGSLQWRRRMAPRSSGQPAVRHVGSPACGARDPRVGGRRHDHCHPGRRSRGRRSGGGPCIPTDQHEPDRYSTPRLRNRSDRARHIGRIRHRMGGDGWRFGGGAGHDRQCDRLRPAQPDAIADHPGTGSGQSERELSAVLPLWHRDDWPRQCGDGQSVAGHAANRVEYRC